MDFEDLLNQIADYKFRREHFRALISHDSAWGAETDGKYGVTIQIRLDNQPIPEDYFDTKEGASPDA